jgi:hypothetical protein
MQDSSTNAQKFESVAFKEWAGICQALGVGSQSVILRRGGIAEGKAGFSFEGHHTFFLYPTAFHQETQQLKGPAPEVPGLDLTPVEPGKEGQVPLALAAEILWTKELRDPQTVARLDPFHLWAPEVIEERFHWKGGEVISAAFVRVYRLQPAWVLPNSPTFGGCRSWIKLPDPPPEEIRAVPVMDEKSLSELKGRVETALVNP